MTTDAGNSRADASWVESMPEVYDRCLGLAVFAPLAGDLATPGGDVRRRPSACSSSPPAPASSPPGLVEALPDAEITATDLNPAMVTYAAALVPGAELAGRRRDGPRLRRRLLRPGGLPVRGDVLSRQGRRPTGRCAACWRRAACSSSTSGTPSTPTTSRPRSPRRSAEVFPDDTARLPGAGAARVRRPATAIRADVQAAGLQFKGLVRNVLVGRSPSAAMLAEGYCLGTPLRFELQERGDLGRPGAAGRRRDDPRLGEGPVEGRLAAYVVRAVKPG